MENVQCVRSHVPTKHEGLRGKGVQHALAALDILQLELRGSVEDETDAALQRIVGKDEDDGVIEVRLRAGKHEGVRDEKAAFLGRGEGVGCRGGTGGARAR